MQARGARVLILTVGQTLAPLEVSLAEHSPDGVVFVASQDSQAVVGELLRMYGSSLKYHTLLLDDPESLTESYNVALRALRKALEWEARVIVADITGGTKPMVAGALLALSGQGVTFSYVGGTRRDALGRVESGSEQVRALEDPTVRYGTREWEGFRRAWNSANFGAALDFLQELRSRPLTPSEGRFYGYLSSLTQGMEAWDRFQHKAALVALEDNLLPALASPKPGGMGPRCGCWEGFRWQWRAWQPCFSGAMCPL